MLKDKFAGLGDADLEADFESADRVDLLEMAAGAASQSPTIEVLDRWPFDCTINGHTVSRRLGGFLHGGRGAWAYRDAFGADFTDADVIEAISAITTTPDKTAAFRAVEQKGGGRAVIDFLILERVLEYGGIGNPPALTEYGGQLAEEINAIIPHAPIPAPDQWRLDVFRLAAKDDPSCELFEVEEIAALSEKYFDTPQAARDAWNDGLPSIMWTLFCDEIEEAYGGAAFLTFNEEAAVFARSEPQPDTGQPPRPPTERMIAAAEKIAAQKGVDLPDLSSGATVRAFLNDHSPRKLGQFSDTAPPPRRVIKPKGGPRCC